MSKTKKPDYEVIVSDLWCAFLSALPFVESCDETLSQELAKDLRQTRDKYEKLLIKFSKPPKHSAD